MPDPKDFAEFKPIDARLSKPLNQYAPLPSTRGSVMHHHNAARDFFDVEWVAAFENGDRELDDAVAVLEVDIERRQEKKYNYRDEITGEKIPQKLIIRSGNGFLYWREMHLRSRWVFAREQSGSSMFPRDVEDSFTSSEEDEAPGMGIALFKDRAVVFDCWALDMYHQRWENFRRKALRIQRSFNLAGPLESQVTRFKGESQYWLWALSMRQMVENGYFPTDQNYICRSVGNHTIANLPTRAEIAASGKCPIEFADERLKAQYMRDMRCRAAVLEGGAEKYSQVPVHNEFTLGLREDWDIVVPVPQIP